MICSNMCSSLDDNHTLIRPEEKVMTKFEIKHHSKFTFNSPPLLLCPPHQARGVRHKRHVSGKLDYSHTQMTCGKDMTKFEMNPHITFNLHYDRLYFSPSAQG